MYFFKQNTSYEMRIRDWSSDVCSSDLLTEFCSTAKFLYSTYRLLTATILCNMANSERLRLNKNQHVVQNLLSKGDDKKVVEAMMHVIEYMKTRFTLKDMGYRHENVDRITCRELNDIKMERKSVV